MKPNKVAIEPSYATFKGRRPSKVSRREPKKVADNSKLGAADYKNVAVTQIRCRRAEKLDVDLNKIAVELKVWLGIGEFQVWNGNV